MSRKGGVQVLDIANTLSEVMTEANFHIVDIDEDFHMKKLSDYLTHNLGEAQYYGDDDAMSNSGGNANDDEDKKKKKDKDRNDDEDKKKKKKDKDSKKDDLPGDQDELDKDKDGDIDAKDLKKLRKESVEAVAEETEEEASAEPTEEEVDAVAEEEQAAQTEDGAHNSEWRDLVASLEDITQKIDLNFDAETADEEEQDIAAGEGEAPTPPQDNPAQSS